MMGAGAFGTALGKILADNSHQVTFFDAKKNPGLTLAKATEFAEVIILAAPSEVIGEVVASLPENLKRVPVILATKGLLGLDLFLELPKFSIISGPTFAKEIIAGWPSTMTATDAIARLLFENAQISIELTDDRLGVMLCGALKNIYAIGAGMLPEAKNTSAAYIAKALNEMRKYLQDHGAKSETVNLACGIGDLVLSATNEESRNYLCGKILSEGGSMIEAKRRLGTVEGLATLESVGRDNYPIIEYIYALVHSNEV